VKLKEGANVFTWDGEKVGSIDRVVLDPNTKEVTHLVVQKGFLFTTDKVVPISLIGPVTEDRVTLREGVGDLEALPDFEEKHYIPTTQIEGRKAPSASYVRPLYWYPPVSLNWGVAGHPIPSYVVRTERHIPGGTVALEEGAKVVSSDGEHVGDVEAVLTDPEQDRATHLLISRGLLLKEEKLVPTTWVSTVSEDRVHLALGSHVLDQLPAYQAQA
jgi:uncharacterized protein YrrD